MSLLSVLTSTHGTALVVLATHSCSKHLLIGGKKHIEYLARIFIPQILTLDLKKSKFDLRIVHVASSVQRAGDGVTAYFYCVTTLRRSEHGLLKPSFFRHY